MKHTVFIMGLMLFSLAGIGGVRIEDVRATPVAPWGRIVVDYTVAGTLPEDAVDYVVAVTASNRTTGAVYTGGATEGETVLTLGKHRVWWNACATGLREAVESIDVRIKYEYAYSYCVVDLSGGPNVANYPVTYLSPSNISSDEWVDEYRTTKLVLRRIKAGWFIMGSDQTDGDYDVKLTKPFYMGVFEVTQKQWELVMGSWPGSSPFSSYGRGDTYPAYYVSYNDIRGSSSAVNKSSFLGRLRAKTGLDFDLPTEAQWEYACRAGTTTTYYWGDTMDGAYAWFKDNSGSATHPVGTKLPNAWGLYDMSGNVWEWCRDWYGTLAYGTDPVGSASGSRRVIRGGSWKNYESSCVSSYRVGGSDPSSRFESGGFRLSRTLP